MNEDECEKDTAIADREDECSVSVSVNLKVKGLGEYVLILFYVMVVCS